MRNIGTAIPDAWDPESDSGKTKWVEHVEVDGKMQQVPKGMEETDLTIKEVEENHAAEKGIICSQCNRENPARAKFCNRCGRPL